VKEHELKTWPDPFNEALAGRKPWEYRLNDRNFQVGETVVRREYDPKTQSYTGRTLYRERIVYMLANGFGIPRGYVILSLEKVPIVRQENVRLPWRPGART
jgi:hypothetical protein